MKILLDAFGGDNSPNEIILGAVESIKKEKGFTVVLVGKKEVIESELSKYDYDASRIEILEADEVISCEEEPVMAIRRKANSSLVKGMVALKENEEYNAFISAGSTGAFLASATLKLGRIENVNRPALCPLMPTIKGNKKVLLLDAGANAECKVINLVQFAQMAKVFCVEALGVKNPKIALLSNGTEDSKGNSLNQEVFKELKKMKGLNFVGNIEARDVLFGEVDAVVTDGFSGNICLKACEGTALSIFSILKENTNKSFKVKMGALLMKPALKEVKNKLDYNKQGGALFLGVKKLVIKAHGSSKAQTITNTIMQAKGIIESKAIEKLKESISSEMVEGNDSNI